MSGRPARRQRVVLLLGSAALALVLAETCLWILDIPKDIASFRFLGNVFDQAGVFEEDADLFWRLDRNTDRYQVNQLGLRGPDVPRVKGPRDLRIACFGDSCTFGSYVRLEDTYGWLLQEHLQQRLPNRRVEVILAGVPGYSSHQSLALFRKHVAPLKPDITVLYIGGWNDYVPAMGESDGARSARLEAERNSLWRRWRLVRLGFRVVARERHLTPAEYVAAFERGEAPDGRRVPLEMFRNNLGTLLREAREAAGSEGTVLVLVPPLPAETLAKYPVALEYRDAVRGVAQAMGAPLVDPTAVFAARGNVAGAELPEPYRGCWPCFVDWVHPSVLGHRLLATALAGALDQRRFQYPPSGQHTTLRNPRPPAVVAGAGQLVTVAGDPSWRHARMKAGRWWIPEFLLRPVATTGHEPRLWDLHLPATVPPGTYSLHLVNEHGLTTCPTTLVVQPPPLLAEISRQGHTITLRFQITGPADWPVGVWVSTAKRAKPAPTRFGLFHLVADPDGRLPGDREDTPFMFLRLRLPQAVGTIPADGTWRHEIEVDIEKLGTVPEQIHVQGLLHRDEAHGLLTGLVTLAVPR